MFDMIIALGCLVLLSGFVAIPAGILTHYIFKEAERK